MSYQPIRVRVKEDVAPRYAMPGHVITQNYPIEDGDADGLVFGDFMWSEKYSDGPMGFISSVDRTPGASSLSIQSGQGYGLPGMIAGDMLHTAPVDDPVRNPMPSEALYDLQP